MFVIPGLDPKTIFLIAAGLIYALVSSPLAWSTTDSLMRNVGGPNVINSIGPSFFGLFLHAVVFVVILVLFARVSKTAEYMEKKKGGKDMYEEILADEEEEDE